MNWSRWEDETETKCAREAVQFISKGVTRQHLSWEGGQEGMPACRRLVVIYSAKCCYGGIDDGRARLELWPIGARVFLIEQGPAGGSGLEWWGNLGDGPPRHV